MVAKKSTDKPIAGKGQNRFNLLDEKWIPVTGKGLVSLWDVFHNLSLKSLGGNPLQKIALLKLLLAICQASCTPKDDDEWAALKPKGLAKMVLEYLEKRRDDFWLYGKKPFLQIPAIAKAAKQPYGAVLPDVATGNTTVFTQSQKERPLSDAEKALLVVQLMGFALGGKKTDNSVVLSPGYQGKFNDKGKPSTGKPGPSLGFLGYLHSFLTGKTIMETLWLNIITKEALERQQEYSKKLGPTPWETPPKGEADSTAEKLKYSLMGRLIPFSRFLLLAEDGIHYSEGISHLDYQGGMSDPSVAIDKSGKTIKTLWADTSKRPWRNLTALLGFLQANESYLDCPYLRLGFSRGIRHTSSIGIWSGGLRVSGNAGEQYVSGTDDYVESETFMESALVKKYFFIYLKQEMTTLDEMSKILYGRVATYCKELKAEGKSIAEKATELFWKLCEGKFQDLVTACQIENQAECKKEMEKLRIFFIRYVWDAYEFYCPQFTARQREVWAGQCPNLGRFVPKKDDAAEAVNQ
ncbi:type I-E CRISPR-associated protein Cse1/CasA [Treponema primitia]|uniref:type I-E CRISPR-associated protein Cse1/CasA n=1 Tax=Treponema primitia TaxID=88058 RepID=UPI0002554C52|nr:type I-E CRISPR-associated protein Cse1/CasA [Treponema primitia]